MSYGPTHSDTMNQTLSGSTRADNRLRGFRWSNTPPSSWPMRSSVSTLDDEAAEADEDAAAAAADADDSGVDGEEDDCRRRLTSRSQVQTRCASLSVRASAAVAVNKVVVAPPVVAPAAEERVSATTAPATRKMAPPHTSQSDGRGSSSSSREASASDCLRLTLPPLRLPQRLPAAASMDAAKEAAEDEEAATVTPT